MKRRHLYLCAAALVAGGIFLAVALWWGQILQPEAGRGRSSPQKVYVVQAISWRFTARGSPHVIDEGRPGNPVKAFLDRDRAVAACRDLNRQRQAKTNPFEYRPEETGGTYLAQYTTKGEGAFLTLVRSEGLIPPVRDPDPYKELFPEPWVAWWAELKDRQQADRLWDAIDRVRFYEVIEVDAE
jgi:hypothetical protein